MTSIHNKWTRLAKECYENDCNCGKCYYRKFLESECEMGNTVQILLNAIGKPPDNPDMPLHYIRVYEYVKNKQRVLRQDILKDLNINKNHFFNILSGLRWYGINIKSEREYLGRVKGKTQYNYWYHVI